MHIFFGDDSVRRGKREELGMLVAFGGVLLHEAALRPVQAAIDSLLRDFGVPCGEELKWSPRRESWIYSNLKGERRTECYRRVLQIVRQHGGVSIVVAYSRGWRPVTEQEALRKCIDWTFERLSMCLEDRGSLGLMICDRPGGGKKEDDALLSSVLATIEEGTLYVPAKQSPINVLTTPSHLVRGLQVADIVTGVTTAMIAGDTGYAAAPFEEIKPMFHRNARGLYGGTGLKLYPDELLNLHHWVGGEDAFVRIERGSQWKLPNPGWPYAVDPMNASRQFPHVAAFPAEG